MRFYSSLLFVFFAMGDESLMFANFFLGSSNFKFRNKSWAWGNIGALWCKPLGTPKKRWFMLVVIVLNCLSTNTDAYGICIARPKISCMLKGDHGILNIELFFLCLFKAPKHKITLHWPRRDIGKFEITTIISLGVLFWWWGEAILLVNQTTNQALITNLIHHHIQS